MRGKRKEKETWFILWRMGREEACGGLVNGDNEQDDDDEKEKEGEEEDCSYHIEREERKIGEELVNDENEGRESDGVGVEEAGVGGRP